MWQNPSNILRIPIPIAVFFLHRSFFILLSAKWSYHRSFSVEGQLKFRNGRSCGNGMTIIIKFVAPLIHAFFCIHRIHFGIRLASASLTTRFSLSLSARLFSIWLLFKGWPWVSTHDSIIPSTTGYHRRQRRKRFSTRSCRALTYYMLYKCPTFVLLQQFAARRCRDDLALSKIRLICAAWNRLCLLRNEDRWCKVHKNKRRK